MKKKINVLVALATMQRQEAYQHLVNRYCEIGDLFEAYKQVTNDEKTSIRSFTMVINSIVNMGFIKDRHFEIFKRKKWKLKSYVIEYFLILHSDVHPGQRLTIMKLRIHPHLQKLHLQIQ
jgi:hypothetical protein